MATTARPQQTLERPLTIEDYEAFPEDGNRYEIIGGQLYVAPSPSVEHQRVVTRLAAAFDRYLEETGNGEVFVSPIDVQFSKSDIVQPDIVVVLSENAEIVKDARIVGAPDLVVEVISPSSSVRDRVGKAALYGRSGVREYWLIDLEAKSIVVQIERDGLLQEVEQRSGRTRSSVLDGFEVDPNRIFRRPGG